MMRRTGILLALLSWAVLVTPWQRCQSECQDILATVAHDCHVDTSPSCHAGHEHPGNPCDPDCDDRLTEHDRLDLGMSTADERTDPLPGDAGAATTRSTTWRAPPRTAAVRDARREPRPPPALAHLACVVLLR